MEIIVKQRNEYREIKDENNTLKTGFEELKKVHDSKIKIMKEQASDLQELQEKTALESKELITT